MSIDTIFIAADTMIPIKNKTGIKLMSPSDENEAHCLHTFYTSQRPYFSISEKLWNPPTDIYETDESVIVKMEIAGTNKNDLDISILGNILRIKGSRGDKSKIGSQNFHIMEIRYGIFERVFRIPDNLDVDNISAIYLDGFLKLTIPKKKSLPQEIKVNIAE